MALRCGDIFVVTREHWDYALQVAKKFSQFDSDGDGHIDRHEFGSIIRGLDLKLSPMMLNQYISVNFKFVDRQMQGQISFGQFLACYANFMYSYEIAQGMRRRRHAQQAAQQPATERAVERTTVLSSAAQVHDHAEGDILAHSL